MKQIKKTQAEGFYVFRGEVAANSNFIETLDEAKQFLIYANFFLNKYLTVYDYSITRKEWQMVVKIKALSIIYSADEHDLSEELSSIEVWRIVSERVRLFLSLYVKTVNRLRGRTGTLVHSSYERYFFVTLHEAKAVLNRIRQQSFCMYNRKPKYRGLKTHYKIPKKLGKGSIFLCSKEVKRDKDKVRNFLENQCLSDLSELVLHQLIDSTKILHKSMIPQLIIPKLE